MASVFISDEESGLHKDNTRCLEELAPFDQSPAHWHNERSGKDNRDTQHKRQIRNREDPATVTKWKLDFNPWHQFFHPVGSTAIG